MPAIVLIDNKNNCIIVIDNCAPYNVTIKRNDILGLMDIEMKEFILLEDSVISSILTNIHEKLPKVPKKNLSKEEIASKAHLNVQVNSNKNMWTFYTNTKKQSVQTSMTWALLQTTDIKFTPKTTTQCTENNLKYLRLINSS